MTLKTMLTSGVLLVAVASIGRTAEQAATGGDDTSAAQTIEKAETGWVDAAKKQDAAPLDAMLADDYTLTNPVGQVSDRSQFIQAVKDGTFKIDSADYKDLKVRVYGSAAVVTGKLTLQGSWQGNDLGGTYAFTDTFVKQDGKWKEVAGQVTKAEG